MASGLGAPVPPAATEKSLSLDITQPPVLAAAEPLSATMPALGPASATSVLNTLSATRTRVLSASAGSLYTGRYTRTAVQSGTAGRTSTARPTSTASYSGQAPKLSKLSTALLWIAKVVLPILVVFVIIYRVWVHVRIRRRRQNVNLDPPTFDNFFKSIKSGIVSLFIKARTKTTPADDAQVQILPSPPYERYPDAPEGLPPAYRAGGRPPPYKYRTVASA